MLTVKIIKFQDTYEIRNKILRPGKPLESCVFEGDEYGDSFHFGIYDEETQIGVASFLIKIMRTSIQIPFTNLEEWQFLKNIKERVLVIIY